LAMIGHMESKETGQTVDSVDCGQTPPQERDWTGLVARLKAWARELGFADLSISRAEIGTAGQGLMAWLQQGYHGTMDYMAKHAPLRLDPDQLVPGVRTVLSVRLPYLPPGQAPLEVLADGELAYVSRYALGRDYHKIIRNRLQKLADRLQADIGPFGYRVFSDSAPVMEVEFAQKSGLGWRGKHTLLLTREGSWHFLGEIYTDLPLPPDAPVSDHCGACTRCIDICPTRAILAPYQVDARRCISYLTIEQDGPIPEELRPLLGNRIYGCDDCQLCCPWNRFGQLGDPEFSPRQGLDAARLPALMAWSEADFLERLAGSPIRRIGIASWRRNIAVALGNGPATAEAKAALAARRDDESPLVREHVAWAEQQLENKTESKTPPLGDA